MNSNINKKPALPHSKLIILKMKTIVDTELCYLNGQLLWWLVQGLILQSVGMWTCHSIQTFYYVVWFANVDTVLHQNRTQIPRSYNTLKTKDNSQKKHLKITMTDIVLQIYLNTPYTKLKFKGARWKNIIKSLKYECIAWKRHEYLRI